MDTIDLGAGATGRNYFTWDGADKYSGDKSQLRYSVQATNGATAVASTPLSPHAVIAASASNGQLMLELDDGSSLAHSASRLCTDPFNINVLQENTMSFQQALSGLNAAARIWMSSATILPTLEPLASRARAQNSPKPWPVLPAPPAVKPWASAWTLVPLASNSSKATSTPPQ